MSSDEKDADPQTESDSTAVNLDLIVHEHEEEVSENGETVRRRGVYLLPNLFTTGALFAGFYAIISAMRGDYESAAIAIVFAGVFDGLDGRVARLTNTTSKFGEQYDSLSDMVSFGVAPSIVMFSWALVGLGKLGWACAFIYVACAALRLARFNAEIESSDQNYFKGLPSPAAAGVLAATVWVSSDAGWTSEPLLYEVGLLVGVYTAVIGLLMVVNIPYYSFKGIDMRGRVPFVVILLLVIVIGLITVDPPKVLLAAALLYAISGPVSMFWSRSRTPPDGA